MVDSSPSTPLAALDTVVLDTETTGLDLRIARFVQIGAVRMRGTIIDPDDRFDRLVDPGVPIPPRTTAIHGIADADVIGAPRYAALADALDAWLGTAVIIGHTIGYDMAILEREERLAGRVPRPRRTLDVRLLAEVADIGLSQFDLDHLASALGVDMGRRHTAIGDAITTARVYSALVPLLRRRGIRTLGEAEAAQRRVASRQSATAGGLPAAVAAATMPTIADGLPALARIDSFSYVHRVADVMSAPPVTAEPSDTVGTVVARMMVARVSSVLVTDPGGEVAIATERDMLRAINARGADGLATPVGTLATRPVHTIAAHDFVYRAIARMERLGIRHLAVVDPTGAMAGMVTVRNLLRHRATTALVLGDAIDTAETARDLGRVWAVVPRTAQRLIADGVAAREIAAVISAEVCAMTRRAAELAERRMAEAGQGAPPVPYAVLVLGSAGRGESLLAADQDNAIVYAEGDADGPVDAWFSALGAHIAAILDEAGIPLCKGGVMAKNRLWRHSLAAWEGLIDSWVGRQRPEDVLNVDIFFDGVPVHGDMALGERVFARAFDAAAGSITFQKQLTDVARRWSAPFTLFGGLRTDGDGRIDLKKHGLLPIFTAARVLAIRHRARARSTPERLRSHLPHAMPDTHGEIDALIAGHGTIMDAMLTQQIADAQAGVPLSPRVDIRQLPAQRRSAVAEAVRTVATAVDLVTEGRLV